jgi:hypothetical protein
VIPATNSVKYWLRAESCITTEEPVARCFLYPIAGSVLRQIAVKIKADKAAKNAGALKLFRDEEPADLEAEGCEGDVIALDAVSVGVLVMMSLVEEVVDFGAIVSVGKNVTAGV